MFDEKAERKGKQIASVSLLIRYQRERVTDLAARLDTEREILSRLHNEKERLMGVFDSLNVVGVNPDF